MYNTGTSRLVYFVSIFLMLTLAWLTVSLPFVSTAKEILETTNAIASDIPMENDETEDPFANTTEEKTSTSVSVSEEYLHEQHSPEHYLDELSKEYMTEQASMYISFYGKLISPPPDPA
jgi:hypothetical protein